MASPGAASDYSVYIGLWTNWSRGKIAGSTITLTNRNGTILTSFLAIFITLVGTSFWRMACFVLHQRSSSSTAQNGLYHQRQAILRNAANGTNGFISFLRIFWTWRSRSQGMLRRIVPLMGLAVICMTLFAAAGVLCSKLIQMDNEVLIASSQCGSLWINSTDLDAFYTYGQHIATRTTSYMDYAQRCYSNTPVATGSCGPFIKQRLASKITLNATCPFNEILCREKDRNIKVETIMNSDSDLGLNTPPDRRLTLKFTTHCAPLRTTGYKAPLNISGKEYMAYYYGPKFYGAGGRLQTPYTYTYEQRPSNKLAAEIFNATVLIPDYNIGLMSAFTRNQSLEQITGYVPIKGLYRPDSDLTMIFLSANGLQYPQMIDDDWYSAHKPSDLPLDSVSSEKRSKVSSYYADEPASVLGCNSQYQVCDLQNDPSQGCSRLHSADDVEGELKSPITKTILNWMWSPDRPSVYYVLEAIGITSLTSRFRLLEDFSGPLPDNQWHLEVENWHNIALAGVQGNVVARTAGPGDTNIFQNFWRKPETDIQRSLCKNQKILSTAYSNFSVLWFVVIITLGSLIIVLDFTFPSAIAWVEKRRSKQYSNSMLEWFTDDLFQLQRLAHEEIGLGTWSNCAGSGAVPFTEKGELLGIIEARDPYHPRLVKSSNDYPSEPAEDTSAVNDDVQELPNQEGSSHSSPSTPIKAPTSANSHLCEEPRDSSPTLQSNGADAPVSSSNSRRTQDNSQDLQNSPENDQTFPECDLQGNEDNEMENDVVEGTQI